MFLFWEFSDVWREKLDALENNKLTWNEKTLTTNNVCTVVAKETENGQIQAKCNPFRK